MQLAVASIQSSIYKYETLSQQLKERINTKLVYYNTIIYNNNLTLFDPIIEKLRNDGVDEDLINMVYSDYRVQMQDRLINMNIHYRESPEDYAHNLEEWAIDAAREFKELWLPELRETSRIYGVPPEVITSILWIETKCGTYLGEHLVVNVFSTLAMLTQPEQMEIIKEKVAERYPEQDFEELIPRIERKANWGYRELLTLFSIAKDRFYIDLLNLRGSWAGAFGLCQFLPSSYKNSAVDGDGDGFVDLFTPIDAFHSVGNYLKKSGWSTSTESQRRAVRSYNNSTYYVNTVLDLASRLYY